VDDLAEPLPRVRQEEAAVVKKTVETTITLRVNHKDLKRVLRLPKYGRLEVSGLTAKTPEGVWKDVSGALLKWDDEAQDSFLVLTHYHTKHSERRLR
jgi:hypothetical protein